MKPFDAVESFLERYQVRSLWDLHENPLVDLLLNPIPPFRPQVLLSQAEVRELKACMQSKEYRGQYR